ncbi:ubiquitin carboxyl-terminal hydrolase 35-like [Rhopilema esculentum]|uniref:ubiquitin carboxyl-terminal hydrolase 35-like n=1 Tax=Rhopilema esculentum TaxID=499914 RepID=UPI0031D35CA2
MSKKLEELVVTIPSHRGADVSHRKAFYELLSHVLSILRTTGSGVIPKKIMDQVINCFLEEDSVALCAAIADAAIRNWNVDSINTGYNQLISKTVSLLRSFSLMKDIGSVNLPVAEVTQQAVNNVNLISNFFAKILATDKTFVQQALGEIFSVLTQEEKPSSVTLTPLLTAIPKEYAEGIAEKICSNPSVTDKKLDLALCKLIDWLAWPKSQNLDEWIITVCQKLLDDGKRCQVVAQVVKKKAVVVFNHMFPKESREAATAVFSFMMLIYQHSPEIFHKVAPRIPSLFNLIEKDNEDPKNQTCIRTLAELVYTLMYMFPGYSNIYNSVRPILKNYSEPSQADMKRWIARSCIVLPGAIAPQSSPEISRKQVRGKTGLTNLGNTCYMNSVIQALFMLKSFRSKLLLMPLSEGNAPLMYNLSKLFAFLLLSERSAISPNDFYKISRPPWFRVGAQQDCSEFLKYLIERIEQEDKSQGSEVADTTIHRMFTGECRVDVKCLNCNAVSSRFEAFNDIPLAFHDDIEEGKRTFSLKGGDISSGRINSRVKGSEGLATGDPKEALDSNSIHTVGQAQASATSSPVMTNNATLTVEKRKDRSYSLQELLNSYLTTESLHGQNQYRCDNCSALQDAERRHLITSCPKFLVLTLKRFTYDIKAHRRGKIMQNVKFPNEITVPVLVASTENSTKETTVEPMDVDADHPNGFEQSTNSSEYFPGEYPRALNAEYAAKPVLKVDNEESKIYSLVAVVVHSGVSSDSGHYYSYCRSKSPSLGNSAESQEAFSSPSDKGGFIDDKMLGVSKNVNAVSSKNIAATTASNYYDVSTNIEVKENIISSKMETTSMNANTNLHEKGNTNRNLHDKNYTNTEEPENEWYLFNDSLVSAVKASEVEKIQNDHPRDTPYVFIYEEVPADDDIQTNEHLVKPELRVHVEADNREYFKGQRNAKRLLYDTNWQPKTRKWNEDDDDKNNGGSSGNFGGGFGGLDFGASRFIY